MIVDRYHLSLSKIRPNTSLAVLLTVTMETEPSGRTQSSHTDPVAGNEISAKVRESMCMENAFVSFLRPPNNNEIQRSQCVSLEYFLRKANVSR